MVAGSGLVFALVLAMNLFSSPPQKKDEGVAAEFKVEKRKPPKKPKPRKARKKKSTPRKTARSSAPPPALSSAVSG